jgi:hypothetical protein
MSTVELTRGTLSCRETEVVTDESQSLFPPARPFFGALLLGSRLPAGARPSGRPLHGPRRQSDGATLGCRAFPRPTRRSPQHSRATPAGGVHGALRPVCGMPPKRRGRPTTAASAAEGAATLSLQSDAGQATDDAACARLPPRPPAARPRPQQAAALVSRGRCRGCRCC